MSTSFRFVGPSFDPADISRRLGIEPTTHYRSGDSISRGVGRRPRDGWIVAVGPLETLEIEGMLHELRERLQVSSTLVRQACTELGLTAVIRCSVELTSTLTPNLTIPPGLVCWAADVGASIEIDVMLWEDGSV